MVSFLLLHYIKTSFFSDPELRRKECFAVSLFAKSFAVLFKNAKDSHEIWWKKAMLRDYINATITFEGRATELGKPSKSVHRMLGPKGTHAQKISWRSSEYSRHMNISCCV